MKREGGFGWSELIAGILLILLGVFTFARPESMLSGLVVVYGIIAIALGIEDIVVESLSEGHGTINCAHGLMPIPVPAVVNLCQAGNIALTPAPVAGELVTPTGAAIVTALRTSDQLPSRYHIEAVGYGAGKRPYEGCSGTLRCLLVDADA